MIRNGKLLFHYGNTMYTATGTPSGEVVVETRTGDGHGNTQVHNFALPGEVLAVLNQFSLACNGLIQ